MIYKHSISQKAIFAHTYPVNISCLNLNKLKLIGLRNINNDTILIKHVLSKLLLKTAGISEDNGKI